MTVIRRHIHSFTKIFFLFCFISLCYNKAEAQNKNILKFDKEKRKKITLKFNSAGNLIIIPVRINQSDTLQFILDTGLKTTVITELPARDSSLMTFTDSTVIKGLGMEEDLTVWYSPGNRIDIGNIFCDDYQFLYIKDRRLDLSADLGVPVHGIIGADVFKAFIVKVNYQSRHITFFRPETFNAVRHYKRYEILPLQFWRDKPYLSLPVVTQENDSLRLTLLVDNGAGDAVLLFTNSSEDIQVPEKSRYSYLGRGINGSIYGYQSRIKSISLGKYAAKDVTASFPDTAALNNVSIVDIPGRNGSIGAELLVRFDMYIDYPNKRIALRKNSYFKRPFRYNMSGLTVKAPYGRIPIYIIATVRKKSPGDIAGVKAGDILLSLNGKSAKELDLTDIHSAFRDYPGKRINLTLNRNGEIIKLHFRLEEDI